MITKARRQREAAPLHLRGSAAADCYGVTRLTRVPQLPSDVRVPPQLPIAPVRYCASVHVWQMYSDASQIELPSVAAAP